MSFDLDSHAIEQVTYSALSRNHHQQEKYFSWIIWALHVEVEIITIFY